MWRGDVAMWRARESVCKFCEITGHHTYPPELLQWVSDPPDSLSPGFLDFNPDRHDRHRSPEECSVVAAPR